MARYVMWVWGPREYGPFSAYESADEMRESFAATGAFNDRLTEQGYLVFADGLQAAETSIVADGMVHPATQSTGPHSDSDEQINGFWVIDVPSAEVAVQLATEASAACRAKIEVRPFHVGPLPDGVEQASENH